MSQAICVQLCQAAAASQSSVVLFVLIPMFEGLLLQLKHVKLVRNLCWTVYMFHELQEHQGVDVPLKGSGSQGEWGGGCWVLFPKLAIKNGKTAYLQ